MSETGDVVWLGDDEALRFPPPDSTWARSGWAAFFSDAVERSFAQVFVRFGLAGNVDWDSIDPAEAAPLIVREAVIRGGAGGGAVTAALVREVPFARIEAVANRRLSQRPDRPAAGELPFLNLDARTRVPGVTTPWARRPEKTRRDRGPSLKLQVPAERKRPDSFYQQVAERFQWLAERGRQPAKELAAANDVPVTTVHRWIKEARRRGILPAARRGESPTPQKGEE